MTELPRSSKYRTSPDEPVTAEEREQLTRRLNDAFSDGKLTQDEYSTKLDELYAAQHLGELVPVVEALPAVQAYNDPAIVQQVGRPGELSTARNGRQLTLVLGGGIAAIVILIVILLVVLL
jgi:hypothetical protein